MQKLFILATFMLTACSITEQDAKNIKDMEESLPPQEAVNVRFIYSDSAVVQAILTAPHVLEIVRKEEHFQHFDQGFLLEFLSSDGKVESELSANDGKVNMQTGIAHATGDVVMINKKGERLETESLHWLQEKDSIYSDALVKIHTEDKIVYGDSMEATTDFSSYKIHKPRGIMKISEEQQR